MPPSAPRVAPRRGQGVVEGAKVSAALLSAFSSLSTDVKSASPADLSEQASTSSPRALVGVRCSLCSETIEHDSGWISRSFREAGMVSDNTSRPVFYMTRPTPLLPAFARVPPLVCPTSRAGRQRPRTRSRSSTASGCLRLPKPHVDVLPDRRRRRIQLMFQCDSQLTWQSSSGSRASVTASSSRRQSASTDRTSVLGRCVLACNA